MSTAGAVGLGGAFGIGGGCACDPIACPPGYLTVPSPSGCCFECQLDYKSCDVQRQNYASYREAVLFKHAPYKCTTASDCRIYYDKNECQVYSCGTLIDVARWQTVEAELNEFARMTCNPACPPPPVPPCEPSSEPTCFKGYCE